MMLEGLTVFSHLHQSLNIFIAIKRVELFGRHSHHIKVTCCVSLQGVPRRNPKTIGGFLTIMEVQLMRWCDGDEEAGIKASRTALGGHPAIKEMKLVKRKGEGFVAAEVYH